MLAESDKKTKIRPIRFTARQDATLQSYADVLSANSGKNITVTWVIYKLLDLGFKEFKEKYLGPEIAEEIKKVKKTK